LICSSALQAQVLQVIIKEADDLDARYGRPRRTEIADSSVTDVSSQEDLIPDEKALIIFSQGGRIKRICDSFFSTQARCLPD
jgi:DNA gyrase/topoisomerase IV subunit A